MKQPGWLRWGGVVVWTAGLAAFLMALDRLVIGIPEPVGWQIAGDLHAVPAAAGAFMAPSYLPELLEWPPRQVLYRVRGARGVWLGLVARSDASLRLWIGVGDADPPQALGAARGCVEARCPAGWLALSRGGPDGRPLVIVTSLPMREARRVLIGLARPR